MVLGLLAKEKETSESTLLNRPIDSDSFICLLQLCGDIDSQYCSEANDVLIQQHNIGSYLQPYNRRQPATAISHRALLASLAHHVLSKPSETRPSSLQHLIRVFEAHPATQHITMPTKNTRSCRRSGRSEAHARIRQSSGTISYRACKEIKGAAGKRAYAAVQVHHG